MTLVQRCAPPGDGLRSLRRIGWHEPASEGPATLAEAATMIDVAQIVSENDRFLRHTGFPWVLFQECDL